MMDGRNRASRLVMCSLLVVGTLMLASYAGAQGTVGIRVSTSNVSFATLSADLDLTMYTRGYGPYTTTGGGGVVGYAGAPWFGYPALDFGDGSTISYASLALTNSGGGPGGSNVYRSLASFSHSYPAAGDYTARTGMYCLGCYRVQYVFFPQGSPVPTAFTASYDLRPDSVIGNLPLSYHYQGTTSTFFSVSSVRYSVDYYPVVSNIAQVILQTEPIPAVLPSGLLVLALALIASGVILLRRL